MVCVGELTGPAYFTHNGSTSPPRPIATIVVHNRPTAIFNSRENVLKENKPFSCDFLVGSAGFSYAAPPTLYVHSTLHPTRPGTTNLSTPFAQIEFPTCDRQSMV